jgi:hypothetical protein
VLPASEGVLLNVEDLNDARTTLAGFFSILLAPHKHDRSQQDCQRKNERASSDPGRLYDHGVIRTGSTLRWDL